MDSIQKVTPDWLNGESHLFLNPQLPPNEKQEFEEAFAKFNMHPGHIWIASSGTSQNKKLIALSKKSFLASAHAVNLHLNANEKDIWGLALPHFHVGGLSIWTRATLLKNKVISLLDSQQKWNVDYFYQTLCEQKVTLSALVPTQVYDLIIKNYKAPAHLRAVIIGGAHLSEDLYFKGRELGWPLLTSYGMTECCSQIATADLMSLAKFEYPDLKILAHMNLKINSQERLKIQSPSLLTGYCYKPEGEAYKFMDPKDPQGWYTTEDLIEIKDGFMRPKGRSADFVKINGEGVSLLRSQSLLEAAVHEVAPEKTLGFAVYAVEDARQGARLVVAIEKTIFTQNSVDQIFKTFNSKVPPFEKLKEFRIIEKIPRTELGKISRQKLKDGHLA